jgi:predicted nucleotidyltransferase
MRILDTNFPSTLWPQRVALRACLQAFNSVYPIHRVWLFGSHARGTPHADSDVDLCIVADGFTAQDEAAVALRRAIGTIRGKPPLTLIPISPERLAEKQRAHDPFFATVLREGVALAEED